MLNLSEALARWTEKIYPDRQSFLKVLAGQKLKIYHGVDPTGPDLHLGHSTNYLLLRSFQDAGHEITLLIGDFTARIGDPSDKTAARQRLSAKEIKENIKNYQKQIGKILRFSGRNAAKISFNSRWLARLRFADFIELAGNVTVQQLIERDLFQKRLKEGKPLYVSEFLYPLAQGYDSVALNTDVEVGGTDQTFNMLMGRDLVQTYRKKEKFVITTPLLTNPQTGQKMMSKTEGNYTSLNAPAPQMYGQVMALADEVVEDCLRFCTPLSDGEISKIVKEAMQDPLTAKKQLAFEITKLYHGESTAQKAAQDFSATFGRKARPNPISRWKIAGQTVDLTDLLVKKGLAQSRSEVRRLIAQGGIQLNGKKVTDWQTKLEKGILKIGKKNFIEIQ